MEFKLPPQQLSLLQSVTVWNSQKTVRCLYMLLKKKKTQLIFFLNFDSFIAAQNTHYILTHSFLDHDWVSWMLHFNKLQCDVNYTTTHVTNTLKEIIKCNYCIKITTAIEERMYYLEVLNFSILNPIVGTMSWVWAFEGKKAQILQLN